MSSAYWRREARPRSGFMVVVDAALLAFDARRRRSSMNARSLRGARLKDLRRRHASMWALSVATCHMHGPAE